MTRANILYFTAVFALIVGAALILWWMGRVPWCECGFIKIWHGNVWSSENSQHLLDWYTFSHVIHGFGFYAILWFFRKRLPFGARLVVAVFLESSWEVWENTDFIINRYREATISLDYYGDSVINSVFDIFAMVAGFVYARRFPAWMAAVLAIAMEVFVLYWIRDNLALNIIMLLYPIDAIRIWQSGG